MTYNLVDQVTHILCFIGIPVERFFQRTFSMKLIVSILHLYNDRCHPTFIFGVPHAIKFDLPEKQYSF